MNPGNGWLDGKLDDPEFHRLYEREDAIEAFLDDVDREMLRQNLTRSELARRMECSPANVTQIMRRTTNLTAATMVDLALALNRRVAFLLHQKEAAGLVRDLSKGLLLGYEEVPNNSELAAAFDPGHTVSGFWHAPVQGFDVQSTECIPEAA